MNTGEIIRTLRLRKGITQEELASKTELSVRTIQRIESGEVDPRAYTLQSIALALDVPYQELAGGDLNQDTRELKSETDKWLPLLHLSGLLLLILPPLIIWIWKRDQVANIRRHASDVMNYQLSMTIYLLPFAFMKVIPVLLVLGLYSQVVILWNTVRVTNYQPYRYRFSIRFFR